MQPSQLHELAAAWVICLHALSDQAELKAGPFPWKMWIPNRPHSQKYLPNGGIGRYRAEFLDHISYIRICRRCSKPPARF